jgi:tetratricopeptide (TPR) repeat protein
MAVHAFVAMPYGTKQGIDFDAVYRELIQPALQAQGFEVFRADQERRAGNIRADMFQELLLADLVVAELSIDNPNVWYELGVRHALRARGVLQIQALRDYLPFDVYVDRSLRYHLTKNGQPDPIHLDADRAALGEFAVQTIRSWHGRKVSPVYSLLRSLQEPEWRKLRVADVAEFWDAYDAWADRVTVARKQQRPGDILVLAEEGPTRVLRLEAYRTAATALRSLGLFEFALEQTEHALELDPDDLESRREKGLLLGRLKRYDEAQTWLQRVVDEHPTDAETRSLLGRIHKDAWTSAWRQPGMTTEQMRARAAEAVELLRLSLDSYRQAFLADPGHAYSAINAATLWHLLVDLTGERAGAAERKAIEGGTRWAATAATEHNPNDYWAVVTLADLEVLVGNARTVKQAYNKAVARADKDWFALDSTRQQLLLLRDLAFRPPQVQAALEVLDRALEPLQAPKLGWQPRLVVLFSGHMIDQSDRPEPRFPADKEPVAAAAIQATLDQLQVGPGDLAISSGACGGDLLFAEAARQRGAQLELHLPFPEPKFMATSVSFAGPAWRDRFVAVRDHERTELLIMSNRLGPEPAGVDPYERNNKWMLYTALAWGSKTVRFIALWDGKGGDGPGGTEHMYRTVQDHAGQVYHLDTTNLW